MKEVSLNNIESTIGYTHIHLLVFVCVYALIYLKIIIVYLRLRLSRNEQNVTKKNERTIMYACSVYRVPVWFNNFVAPSSAVDRSNNIIICDKEVLYRNGID